MLRIAEMPFPFFFFFNDTATTEIYTLSLHDALPICTITRWWSSDSEIRDSTLNPQFRYHWRSEEHTSELQSPDHLVCRLLLEKKNTAHPATLHYELGIIKLPQPSLYH